MSQVVLNVSRAGFAGITHVIEGSYGEAKAAVPTREVIVLASILAALQICDGVLTAAGINAFGISAEGNLLLRHLMEQIGAIPALVLVKALAITVTAMLCSISTTVGWIRHAMKVVIAVYLVAAIVPWTVILLNDAL